MFDKWENSIDILKEIKIEVEMVKRVNSLVLSYSDLSLIRLKNDKGELTNVKMLKIIFCLFLSRISGLVDCIFKILKINLLVNKLIK